MSEAYANAIRYATFKYDAFGRRVQKFSDATNVTTNYIYDGANILEELDASGNVVARYTQGAGVDEPLAMQRGSSTYYYQADGLGSITSLSDSSGVTAATYQYDPYGNALGGTGSITNPFRFTGREYDSLETGLYYYRARYYDPSVGRFLSEDPVEFKSGINFYRYVDDNPINATDPSGLFPTWFHRELTLGLAKAIFGPKCLKKAEEVTEANAAQDQNSFADNLNPSSPVWDLKGVHFPTQKLLNQEETDAFGLCNTALLGKYLHSLQDMYGHAGFASQPFIHWISEGFYPWGDADSTALMSNARVLGVADSTASVLLSFKNRCLKCCK